MLNDLQFGIFTNSTEDMFSLFAIVTPDVVNTLGFVIFTRVGEPSLILDSSA
jgi:hypothetical protein